MAGKEPDIGTTARTVAANVKRLRGELNYTQLSERLQQVAGWSINAVGIRRIESGERRVTPDDLVALALALQVSPSTLLMPDTETADESVQATGIDVGVEAHQLWRWLVADAPLTGDTAQAVFGFLLRSTPGWLFGDQIDLIESGLGPSITHSVRTYGSEQILREHSDGDD
jgi:transcriptional regulator with XRE-family HTH domain